MTNQTDELAAVLGLDLQDAALYSRARAAALPPHGRASVAYVERQLGCGYQKTIELLERMVKQDLIQTYSGRSIAEPKECHHLEDLNAALKDVAALRAQVALLTEQQAGTVWLWQAEGGNDLPSMGNTMGVLIYAGDLRALLAQAQVQAFPNDAELPEIVLDAVAGALGDAFDCGRTWAAWSYGTMGPEDFSTVAHDSDRVAEIARAAIHAHRTAPGTA